MKAMVLAAGLGTRLQPLTFELPKPMMPVLDRPVMAHIVQLIGRQGFDELVANLHHYPDAIRGYFGDRLEYSYEDEPLGTAGGVRHAADFFGEETITVVSGDALTDVDLTVLLERHRTAGGIATLTVKRVPDTREFGVVVNDEEGRVQGFQEKPEPDEALSEVANCGIYCFEREIFDYFPDEASVDWASDVFPALLEHDVPFYVHETEGYWNDIGNIDELRQGTYDMMEGRVGLEVRGEEVAEGVRVGEGSSVDAAEDVQPPVWIGQNCRIGERVTLMGPVVVGDGCSVGDGASVRDSIMLPGTEVAEGGVLIGAVYGHFGLVESLRRPAD
ncbi:MAG: NDP-sugar synthase [Actinomycetota bacterium]|nr:NDP-sugar synthase [Actinomycetota bacterium]